MPPNQLPIDTFPAWALLNSLDFAQAKLQDVEGKGFGLVSRKDIASEDDGGASNVELLRIPHDLILSSDAIENYAKVDQNFKQLLDAAGRQSARGDIMLYLLSHLVMSKRGQHITRGCAPTPWSEYVKFLPRPIPVPTMWTEAEQLLLRGTSLESALEAKMSALANEFDQLREDSSKLQFWYTLFWEHGTTGLEDWALVDAWYRSRCLELPHTGVAMVPGLDMANHSPSPTAYYEEDGKGDVALLMRQDRGVSCGDEISISYGEAKSAGEMLFSYGFIDKDSNAQEMTLHLNTLPDDPLAMAKLHVFGGPPAVKFFVSNEEFSWDCQFVYLMCVNEEDGLDLQVVQDAEGNRHLRLFWQEDDVTERARDFKTLIQGHPLCQVFKLRAVAVLLDRVETQLDRIGSEMFHNMAESLGATDPPKESCIRAVELLRENETKILTGVAKVLEHQKAKLLTDRHVVAYLGSMEDTQNEQASPGSVANEEEDFS